MLRRLVLLSVLVVAPRAFAADDPDADAPAACACDLTPAACDAACACDLECEVDWTADECAAPGASCLPEAPDADDATLSAAEAAAPAEPEAIAWTADAAAVRCPDGATAEAGHCTPDPEAMPRADLAGGCASSSAPGLVVGALVLGVLVLARRRRLVLALAIASCAVDAGSWDDAVSAGATGDGDAYLDVYGAELGDGAGAQLLLDHQALAPDAHQPTSQFTLARTRGDLPVLRIATAHGDRLVTTLEPGAELLGWARATPGDGTAELVELQAPDGAFVYETDPEAVDELVAAGHTVVGTLAHVWPPGLADVVTPEAPAADDALVLEAPAPCTVSVHAATRSALVLLYASPGKVETLRFLKGCPGEVVVGEKRESGPRGAMTSPAARAAGGRSGFVLDRNGDKLRALLLRTNGVERTVQYLKTKLAHGYDYIVIDEITAAPDFRDGTTLNRRLRTLIARLPARTVIPYISIDLTQYPNGFSELRARRLLLRTFKRRARALALEIYLHTPQVAAGAAPATYRRAADRLALAVSGLAGGGGINLRAISVIGTSMHSTYPQYRYLDQPAHDLASITRQVNAIRHGSKRLRQQHGVGYYFVGKSDMAPRAGAPYSYDGLIRRMRTQALRFR